MANSADISCTRKKPQTKQDLEIKCENKCCYKLQKLEGHSPQASENCTINFDTCAELSLKQVIVKICASG